MNCKNLKNAGILATILVAAAMLSVQTAAAAAAADNGQSISQNTTRLTNGIVSSLADNVPAAVGLAVILVIVALAFGLFNRMGAWH